jgi:hypothetical protein
MVKKRGCCSSLHKEKGEIAVSSGSSAVSSGGGHRRPEYFFYKTGDQSMVVFPIQNGSSNSYDGRSKEASCNCKAATRQAATVASCGLFFGWASKHAFKTSYQVWAGRGCRYFVPGGCIRGVNLIINDNFQNCCGCIRNHNRQSSFANGYGG